MNKCLRITFRAPSPKSLFQSFIQKNAKKLEIEGTVQQIEQERARIVACGLKENIDKFLDILQRGDDSMPLEEIEVEPFLKDKDYRGVFRIIE